MDVINDDQYTGMGWLFNNFGSNKEVFDVPYKINKFKDGYKVTLNIDDLSKYKNNDKSVKELQDELLEDLEPWFEGTKKEGNKVIIPICSKPLEKEDESQS
jgi:hypothetical protein